MLTKEDPSKAESVVVRFYPKKEKLKERGRDLWACAQNYEVVQFEELHQENGS